MSNGRRRNEQDEHRQVLSALQARDAGQAATILHTPIAERRDQIVAQVREGYARIYLGTKDVPNDMNSQYMENRK
jgi:DNA-binding GntR family transcriptional regulator